MPSSPLNEKDKEKQLAELGEQQTARVEEAIRDQIMATALELSIIPEGLVGQLDLAFKIDRKALVIQALRNVATTLEKGYVR